MHPLLNQAELRAVNAQHNIVTEAYSPLAVGRLVDNPTVTSIAGEYSRTPAQVLIRWSIQLGNVVIPRSAKPERIAENLDVFDFELAAEHMDALNGLNDGTRVREDPLTYTGYLASLSGRAGGRGLTQCIGRSLVDGERIPARHRDVLHRVLAPERVVGWHPQRRL